MSVSKILKENIVEVRVVIRSLGEVFTTHQFIHAYAKKYKRRYDGFLYLYRDKGIGAVQRVHSQMARFLTQREGELGIERTRKIKSRNVLDKVVWVQEWRVSGGAGEGVRGRAGETGREGDKGRRIEGKGQRTAAQIAARLGEKSAHLIKQIDKIMKVMGEDAALELLQETLEIEAKGGMRTHDGKRRRTAGGVYMYRAKGRATPEQKKKIFPPPRWKSKKKPQIEPFPWGARLKIAPQLREQKGQANSEKLTLVGRPGRIEEREGAIMTIMQGGKAPDMPKGLPLPPPAPLEYAVYISRKQWRKVAEALKDPADKLIVEGFPIFDSELKGMALLAQFVTTTALKRQKKEKQKG